MATTKYLSSEGLVYYDSLVQAKLDKKQDIITDLDTIRANASTGAGLATKVNSIAEGAQANVIETVKVNGEALEVTNKSVNVDISGKADKSTSLSGYGITDAYTKTEVDNVVSVQIAKIVDEDSNGKIDTLKEIAAWITNDTTGAAKMGADIEALKTGKQDTISDLSAIRTAAEAGSTYAASHASDEVGAQANVIEKITVNGVEATITDKTVNIDLAAASVKFSDAQTAALNSGITADLVETYNGYADTIASKMNSSDLSALTNDEIKKLIEPEE